jgi:hypothetical protein
LMFCWFELMKTRPTFGEPPLSVSNSVEFSWKVGETLYFLLSSRRLGRSSFSWSLVVIVAVLVMVVVAVVGAVVGKRRISLCYEAGAWVQHPDSNSHRRVECKQAHITLDHTHTRMLHSLHPYNHTRHTIIYLCGGAFRRAFSALFCARPVCVCMFVCVCVYSRQGQGKARQGKTSQDDLFRWSMKVKEAVVNTIKVGEK